MGLSICGGCVARPVGIIASEVKCGLEKGLEMWTVSLW